MTNTNRQYFHDMYKTTDDPWSVATSPYELRKYALTVAALPNERYRNVFEPGCSIGVLSERLASRCDQLLCTDVVPAALATASSRLRDYVHVKVEYLAIPELWPSGPFDLIVLSEVCYYFDVCTLNSILSKILKSTDSGAHIVGVHWRGDTNYPATADEVHDRMNRCPNFRRIVHHVEPEFVLDVWERE